MKKVKLLNKIITGLAGSLIFLLPEAYAADAYINFHTSKNYLNHINKGYIAIDTRNYPLALKEFLTAKYINDELFAAYDGLGRIYELTRNYGRALESYQRALNLISPKYALDIIQKIKISRQNQETRKSLGLYKLVLSIRPESGLQVLYGDKNAKEGKLGSALINYQRAYKLQEDPQDYLKYLQIKYPNKEYERYIIRKYIQKSLRYPEAHFKAGLINLQKKDYDKAIEEFSIAVSQITVPSFENKYISFLAQAHYYNAISKISPDIKSLDKAIDLFEKYDTSEPNNPDTLFKLANAYFYKDIARMNIYDKELENFEKNNENITGFKSKGIENIQGSGELNSILNKKYNLALFDKTLEILKRIQDFETYDPGVYYSLGNVYVKKAMIYHKGYYDRQQYMNSAKVTARDRALDYYQKALSEYKTYIGKNPKKNGLVYYEIGLLYYQISKLEPDIKNLPITNENQKEYQRWGPKYYKRDMLGRANSNFKIYLNYYPGAKKTEEVNHLIREIQLAMVANW